jgi:hypothetical protein
MHTPSSAARAAGVSKSTIYAAIKAGRLSAQKLHSGKYAIFPAELRRAFPSAPLLAKAADGIRDNRFGFPIWELAEETRARQKLRKLGEVASP